MSIKNKKPNYKMYDWKFNKDDGNLLISIDNPKKHEEHLFINHKFYFSIQVNKDVLVNFKYKCGGTIKNYK